MPIHAWSVRDRPRERLRSMGPSALSDRELVAILVGSGGGWGGSALDVVAAVLEVGRGSLRALAEADSVLREGESDDAPVSDTDIESSEDQVVTSAAMISGTLFVSGRDRDLNNTTLSRFFRTRSLEDASVTLEMEFSETLCGFPGTPFEAPAGQANLTCTVEGVTSVLELDGDGSVRVRGSLGRSVIGVHPGGSPATVLLLDSESDVAVYDGGSDTVVEEFDLPEARLVVGVARASGDGLLYVGRFSSDGFEADGWVEVYDQSGVEVNRIADGLNGTGTLILPARILFRGN